MTQFSISTALFEKFPSLQVGLLVLRDFDNITAKPEFLAKLRTQEQKIQDTLTKEQLSNLEELKLWRAAYSSFGAKPKKYKASIEALLRRVTANEPLPSISPLVDAYNYISIKYKLPVGADDLHQLAKLSDNPVLSFAKGHESFHAIGSDELKNPSSGEVVYKAGDMILCRRWNWRECDATKITEQSKDIVIYIESLLQDTSILENALAELQELLGGETYLLTKEQNHFDFQNKQTSHVAFDEYYPTNVDHESSSSSKEQSKEQSTSSLAKNSSTQREQREFYHWAEVEADKIIRIKGDKEEYILESGITPSGYIHAGNFREVITGDLIQKALERRGKKVRFLYVWDDYDVLRKVPVNLPNQELIRENLRKPVFRVPDPFGNCHEHYAAHFEEVFENEIKNVGIKAENIYQHKRYLACQYAHEIKTALEHTKEIQAILNEYRKEPLDPSWLPIFVFCENCHRDELSHLEWLGGYEIAYQCKECEHSNTVDFRTTGVVTLRWRVDWPMRWHHNAVDFESAGKDHFAAGGSVTTGYPIQEKVFGTKHPYGFVYEWIGIKGVGEFSSSKGNVITVTQLLEVYEPEILRYIFAGTRPNKAFSITFGLEVFKIYEEYDKLERIYFKEHPANEKTYSKSKAIYELSQVGEIPTHLPYQPSFRHLTTILQINQGDIDKSIGYYEAQLQSDFDRKRLRTRAQCVKNWLEQHADEEFKFEVQETCQVSLDAAQQKILKTLAATLREKEWTDAELHEQIYVLAQNAGIDTKDFFALMYSVLINKEKGPRLASFILEIGRENVAQLLENC